MPEQIAWLVGERRAGKSERTEECYTRDLRDVGFALSTLLGRTASTSDLSGIDQAEIDAFVERWLAEGVSMQTVLRRLAALRGFARHLITTERSDCGGILAAKLPIAPKTYQEPIADENCRAVTSVTATLGRWTRARDRAAFLLQSDAGLTTAEVVGLDCKDVMRSTCTLAVAAVRPLRIAAVSMNAMEAVDLYASASPFEWRDERPLFLNQRGSRLSVRSIQVSFRRRADALGVARTATPMSLRHRAGQKMAAAGCTPAFVAERLGIQIHSVARYFVASRLRLVASADRRPKHVGRRKNLAVRLPTVVTTRSVTGHQPQRSSKTKT
jgi:integrase/recombinase XerC